MVLKEAELAAVRVAAKRGHAVNDIQVGLSYLYQWINKQTIKPDREKIVAAFENEYASTVDLNVLPVKRDTTFDLFNAVLQLVRDNGEYEKAAAIMDYVLPERYEVIELTNYRFDFVAVPQAGGNEGIYIDCYLWGEYTQEPRKVYCNGKVETEYRRNIATLKTLEEGLESFKIMGELCGALTYYARVYINREIDRYTPDAERENEARRQGGVKR